MKITLGLKILFHVISFLLFTLLSQVGGVAYLIHLLVYYKFRSKFKNRRLKYAMGTMSFMVFYSLVSFVIVPPIAALYGKERLPFTEKSGLKPATIWTCLLNRNYIRKELKTALLDCVAQLKNKYPGVTIHYLDGTFPLFKSYSLFPHFSHRDGRKLDLSFIYYQVNDKNNNSDIPSWWGYGVCEHPRPGEINTPAECAQQGHWQYSLLEKITLQNNKSQWLFDEVKTKEFIELFNNDKRITRMFLEPHLVERMQLSTGKIRFHSCRAVRHDDHLHIEMSRR